MLLAKSFKIFKKENNVKVNDSTHIAISYWE